MEAMASTRKPFCLRRASSAPASFAARPPPAAGFTMAKNLSLTIFSGKGILHGLGLNRQDGLLAVELAEPLCEFVALDFQRGGEREIVRAKNHTVDALVVGELRIAHGNFRFQFVVVSLSRLEMDHKQELLIGHGSLRPYIVGSKYAQFFDF